jgi:8-oxo-dGTP pyrophosphatase MutT (NUDIX family)
VTEVERQQLAGLPRHVVGVAGVVVDDGRALVVERRTPQRWEVPGGALEHGESIPEGVVREVREETGLDVQVVRLCGVYQNVTLGPVALVFLCRRVGGTEGVTDETTDWRWVRRDEALTLMTPARAARVLDALTCAHASPAPDVPLRRHDGVDLLD